MPIATCEWCNKQQKVEPKRALTYRFCSYDCRSQWRKVHWTKENNPLWQGGDRKKVCQSCNKEFSIKKGRAISLFRSQKFCSHECGVEGRDTIGEKNPNWRGGHAKRPATQKGWAQAVISRDLATCQECGSTNVELHAHHIKPFKDHPELKWDVDNGTTLCFRCHWAVHTVKNANAVNSGKPLTGGAEGNPEPSRSGNISEGVTTRGRAYRRWEGNCAHCGTFLSKRLSDVVGKSFIACSSQCAGKHNWTLRRQRQ